MNCDANCEGILMPNAAGLCVKTCHANCKDCFGLLDSECYSCSDTFYLNGNTC